MLATIYAFALAAPTLLAYNAAPSATLLNQLLAFIGWGTVLRATGPLSRFDTALRGVALLMLALAFLVLAALSSWLIGSLPSSLALPKVIALLGAGMVVLAGWAAVRPAAQRGAALALGNSFRPYAIGLVVAGTASGLIAVLQVLLPQWVDGAWIAYPTLPGRAFGNMRQPNHLSSLLVWGLVALVPLVDRRHLSRWSAGLLTTLMVLGVVLTASRTGTLGIVLIALWGLADERLSRDTRLAMIGAALLYGLLWAAMAGWAVQTHHVFGGTERLAEHDLSASRFAIWSNTLALIKANPWTGVGFGEFNIAWTLTPFPDRPVAFFDHTHNLPLQLIVELGIPLGSAVLALLLAAFWLAFRRAFAAPDDVGARAAVMVLLLIGLHSMLEYPLWYAYFLLPAAWAWGYALGANGGSASFNAGAAALPPPPGPRLALWLRRCLLTAGASMWLLAALAALDYSRVVVIFSPSDEAEPLPERIEKGQHSVLFGHHADYAASTTYDPPTAPLDTYRRTAHSLLETRLMIAWARAYAQAGDEDRASYIAARLREFRKADAAEFFAPCAPAAAAASAPGADPQSARLPFQCRPPTRALTWRDFK